MFLRPLFGKASLGSELVHVAPKTAIGPCQHRIIFVLSDWSTSATQLPIQAAVPLALLLFPSWACDENYMCIAQWYDLMFARLWGTGHECYVTDIMQFLRVNQFSAYLEAPSWWTNDDCYASEASKNPAFFEKNVTFFVAASEILQTFKTTWWFANRNVTRNYYYLCRSFLWSI